MPDRYISGTYGDTITYDYIFAGTGASASLLLLQMHSRNLLHGAKVLLIDPVEKTKNDRTFCFWAQREEPISTELDHIISCSWDDAILPNAVRKNLAPFTYHHIAGIDLYNQIRNLAEMYSWDWLISSVDHIAADQNGPHVFAEGKLIRGKKVFDSRPPIHSKPKNGQTHIFQSFIGWVIETNEEIKDNDAFRIMDFSIEQDGFTQFMYVLPYTPKTALVELTRFGSEIIRESEAESLLEQYSLQHFGQFKKIHTEVGCIPMSSTQIENDNVSGINYLGARNYNIKPSTGYAFKNMFYHARALADSIENSSDTETINKQHKDTLRGRFAFYDSLLLEILEKRPIEGKLIFTELFRRVEPNKILRFLDEKTSIIEDIGIFSKLPWQPFLKALLHKSQKFPWFTPIVLTLITLILIAFGHESMLQSVIGYGLFFAGLVTIGIPHGAVDHLLETGKWDLHTAPRFILLYLLQAAIVALIWIIYPPLAVILFICYSAWHFGQADGKEWKFTPITSFVWGLSVLLYILGTHQMETNSILASMGAPNLPFSVDIWSLIIWLPFAFYRRQLSFATTIIYLMLSSQLPLIFAFGLYFIGQHSLTNWKHIRAHLNLSNQKIWLQSLPFHAAAWILLAVVYLFGWKYDATQSFNPWGLFFIFIACISFPHVISMHSVYKAYSK